MQAFLENILVMILTIAIPLTCLYLVLVVIGWGLKIKSGNSEQQGLTDLWLANQAGQLTEKQDCTIPDEEHPAEPSS